MRIDKPAPANLPDFLIIGAAKSGTTSLFFYLAQHPDIFLPTEFKEPGYLCFAGRQPLPHNPAAPCPDMWSAVIPDFASYANLFADSRPGQRVGEATPEYLYLHDRTIETIRTTYGEKASALKYIAILRNPISRIWSHYWMFRRDGYETLPFDEAVSPGTIEARRAKGWHPSYDYRGFGLYAEQIAAWQDAFGCEALKVVLLDDLQKDTAQTCAALFRHLGVEPDYRPDTSTNYNVSGALRHDWVHELLFRRQYALKSIVRDILPAGALQAIKQRLLSWNAKKVAMPASTKDGFLAYYRNDIEALQRRINRDLSGWLA